VGMRQVKAEMAWGARRQGDKEIRGRGDKGRESVAGQWGRAR